MTASLQPLLDQLHRTVGPALWLADESNAAALASLANYGDDLTLISNRFDIAKAARQLGINAHFSDFDMEFFKHLPTAQRPQQAFYRVSKERPVANHIFNSVFNMLPAGGSLWLSGQKAQGIKTYFSQAGRLFGCNNRLIKLGDNYCGRLEKKAPSGEYLNDKDYTKVRWVKPADGEEFLSKPGTYGWDKIDKGSAFLAAQIPNIVAERETSSLHFLDLGCGYGYLTLQCRNIDFASVTATDNNAAAVHCAGVNFDYFSVPAKVVADDCGASLAGPYDLILCNPPFHQGFNVEGALTGKFLANALRLLAPGGRAYFVVNVFIPLETKARSMLANRSRSSVAAIANDGRFKVIEMQKQ
jgi:16S rRNA (guanine1207-N2)-methyltransferase